jgi:hypothetical protein
MQRINEPEMMRQGKYADIVSRGEAIYQQLNEELEGSYRGRGHKHSTANTRLHRQSSKPSTRQKRCAAIHSSGIFGG